MSRRPARRAALLFALALAGCGAPTRLDAAGPTATTSAPATAPPTASPATAPAPQTAALEALYRARVDSARTRFTPADVRFMTGMVGHHAQALVMAAMAPTHGASPAVQRLAARIDHAQRDEIATMQRWLADRGQPVPEVHAQGATLMTHGAGGHAAHGDAHGAHGGAHGAGHASMPGMLTEAQLQALDAARGTAFDRLFLAFMIQHHGGAVAMVDELFATDGAGQDEEAFKLASDVQVDQRTEIARMQQMLDALPPADGAP